MTISANQFIYAFEHIQENDASREKIQPSVFDAFKCFKVSGMHLCYFRGYVCELDSV